MMFAPPPYEGRLAWTFSPQGDGHWYPCAYFSPEDLRKIVTPGTLIAVETAKAARARHIAELSVG